MSSIGRSDPQSPSLESRITPLRVFLLTLGLIFSVELVVMLVLPAILQLDKHPLLYALADSVLLVCVLAPALWYLVVRPVRRLASDRRILLAEQFDEIEVERARIGHDLHDELGQLQTAIQLAARAVLDSHDLPTAQQRAATLHELTHAATEATRRVARGLAPTVLQDFGLATAVRRLAEDVTAAAGPRVSVESSIADRYAHKLELGLYRVIQEAVTNAVRHSRASRIEIELTGSAVELSARITDDGDGSWISRAPDIGQRGLGIAGIRERVSALGGVFGITRTPRGGSSVTVSVPLRESLA